MPENNKIEEDYLNNLLSSLMTDEEGNEVIPDEEEIEEAIEEEIIDEELIDELNTSNDFDEEVIKDLYTEPIQLEEDGMNYSNDDIDANSKLKEEMETQNSQYNDELNSLENTKDNFLSTFFNKFFSKKNNKKDNTDDNIIKEINKKQEKTNKKLKKKRQEKGINPKEKKVKEKKTKKIKNLVKEKDEVIKITFKGFLIILTIIFIIILLVNLGGNIFYKSQKEKLAFDFYQNKDYSAAYNELSGLELEGDKLYAQLRTIMYINNDYDTYIMLKNTYQNEEALDYLIRGVANYDKHKESATELGVLNDFDYVLEKIIVKLKEDYNITLAEARELLTIKNKQEYSKKIYAIANN